MAIRGQLNASYTVAGTRMQTQCVSSESDFPPLDTPAARKSRNHPQSRNNSGKRSQSRNTRNKKRKISPSRDHVSWVDAVRGMKRNTPSDNNVNARRMTRLRRRSGKSLKPVHARPTNGNVLYALVRKRLTFVEHRLNNIKIGHALTALIPTTKRKQSIFLLNVFSNPSQRSQIQSPLAQRQPAVGRKTLIACGDVNAMETAWV
ncbi:hypothetical protein HPB48_001423 [Haemaphysalis longicornis]|uniref:Endonuclease/exonuclease/phosphatase domain-containing protein n=1 Tax=Haemaphysalis longicornis TaxID=44386 RepID=A0A9J6GND5_HAELO|nr:hypothetical protein HPB48_001423 [Haemaphysalis longicornis]